jgi:predicted nucleotide-binding protein
MQRLLYRINELEVFRSNRVKFNDPQVEALESEIASTIADVFGPESREARDNEHHQIADGPLSMGMSPRESQTRFERGIARSQALLEGLIKRLDERRSAFGPVAPNQTTGLSARETVVPGNRVFVVHGRNVGLREEVARTLEKLGLDPVILHEQPDHGRTIIEKFEAHAREASFAVVILSGDDRGGLAADDPATYKLRSRQNVIFELGFFVGALGRSSVCALYESGVEIPSDFVGVLFVPLESGWHYRLGKALREAGFEANLHEL